MEIDMEERCWGWIRSKTCSKRTLDCITSHSSGDMIETHAMDHEICSQDMRSLHIPTGWDWMSRAR